jgi:hypothetical protein
MADLQPESSQGPGLPADPNAAPELTGEQFSRVRPKDFVLELAISEITIADPCRFFGDEAGGEIEPIDPKESLVRHAALAGRWTGTALLRLDARGIEGGCTHVELISPEAEAPGVRQISRHIFLDTATVFVGDGAALAKLSERYSWHQFIKEIEHPALRLYDQALIKHIAREETTAERGSELVVADKLGQELLENLIELRAMQMEQAEKAVGEIAGVGILCRASIGDGNYPMRLRVNERQEIVAISIDLEPFVRDM